MTMFFGGRSPTGARRVVIIILMVGIGIVGLSRIGGDPEYVHTVERRELQAIPEADPRGTEHLMMVSALEMLQGSTSFRFMYASAASWTSGTFVAPDRVDQRVIVGRTNAAPVERVRRIGDETWVSASGGGGWESVSTWGVPADPVVLSESAATLAEYAGEVYLADKPGVATTPSGDRLPSHKLSGRVDVEALGRAGLVPEVPGGIPPEGADVRFDMLVERETGLPVEIVFHGIPPARPPLAVLHIFDHNSVEEGSVVEPEIPVVEEEVLTQAATADRESQTRTPAPDGLTSPSVGLDGPDALPRDLYVEQVREDEAGEWRRYVLPTEGYSIAAPNSWAVSVGKEGVEVSEGRRDGIHGVDADRQARWSVYRIAERGALLSLGQRRVDSILADSAVDANSLGFTTVELAAGPAVRVEYRIGGASARWVCEYILVRGAPALPTNLGYSIELSSADDGRKAELEEIAATFGLLMAGR